MATDTRSSSAPKKSSRISDEDIDRANDQLPLAFSLLGLYHDGNPVCPKCQNSKKKTVVFKTSKTTNKPYWKCYVCGENGSGLKLYQEISGLQFVDAVNTLLGRETTKEGKKVDLSTLPPVEPAFQAVVDAEVYNTIRDMGSLEAAQEYWMTVAHIPAEVVAESRSTMILDAKKAQKELLERFGRDRLIECGVITVDKNGKDFFLAANEEYPVGEWHHSPAGHVVGAQFRPTLAVKAKVDAHKAWKRQWVELGEKCPDPQWVKEWTERGRKASEAWEKARETNPAVAGKKVEYVTPFLSLKGAGPLSLVGCGLDRIRHLPAGSVIYVVEGFKDMLAARAMGAEAYAMPGTGNMPPERVCELLKGHNMLVCLDGDAAGEKGRKAVMAYFAERGVPATEKTDMPSGFDVADIYAQRMAHTGCKCELCASWRAAHPGEDPQTCTCLSCVRRRQGQKRSR